MAMEEERRAFIERCKPYFDELLKIENSTPVSHVISSDDFGIIGITKEVSNS